MGTEAGNGIEAEVANIAARFADMFQLLRHLDLGRQGLLCFRGDPVQEGGQQGAVADMSGRGAGDLDIVLAGTRQQAGIISGERRGACGLDRLQPVGGGQVGVDQHTLAGKGFQALGHVLRAGDTDLIA